MNKSVYQSEDYKEALRISGAEIVQITPSYYAVVRSLRVPLLGVKQVLEARGTPSKEELIAFKEKASSYWYGTIAPTVVSYSHAEFIQQGYYKVANATILLNVLKEEAILWKQLEKKSIRWGVNAAERAGLLFVSATEKDITEFYHLYIKTAREGNFKAESLPFIQALSKSNKARVFVVKRDKKIVGGGMLLLDRLHAYTILDLTAASEEGLKLQAMPFLYWNLILFSKKMGFKTFDLGGYDQEAKAGEKTAAINKFKERFGGEVSEQPFYATNRTYSRLRSVLREGRFLKKLYRKT